MKRWKKGLALLSLLGCRRRECASLLRHAGRSGGEAPGDFHYFAGE